MGAYLQILVQAPCLAKVRDNLFIIHFRVAKYTLYDIESISQFVWLYGFPLAQVRQKHSIQNFSMECLPVFVT